MKNVKNMCVEDVRVVSVVKISDSLMKRGNVVAWQEMMRNKRDMALNTVTYSIKVNNRYEKNVKFVFNAITQKTTDATDPRKVYYSIEIEDVDGEFGKIICTNLSKSITHNRKLFRNTIFNIIYFNIVISTFIITDS